MINFINIKITLNIRTHIYRSKRSNEWGKNQRIGLCKPWPHNIFLLFFFASPLICYVFYLIRITNIFHNFSSSLDYGGGIRSLYMQLHNFSNCLTISNGSYVYVCVLCCKYCVFKVAKRCISVVWHTDTQCLAMFNVCTHHTNSLESN